jgi:hypothetical protein
MRGGALGACPPGFMCMDTPTMLMWILIAVTIAAIGVYIAKEYGFLKPVPPTVVVVNRGSAAPAAPPVVVNADPRFAPLVPERSYGAPPDRGFAIPAGVGAMPVNTLTRGLPDAFQQVGVLTAPGGTSNSASPTRTILPLFGRAIDSGRNRWNYYTRTDGMNPVQVPVQFKRRGCDDDNGCDEILEGDSVGVPVLGQSYTANIYRYSTPRYLPV